MRANERLGLLLDQGAIQEVVRPLMAGKEAEVYLVVSDDELRVAKLYKSANHRSFKHRAEYTEGRKTRNTRSQRAMSRRSRFGREQEEEAWRNAEVDTIYRLNAAGVRVPEPYDFVEGVLIMELIKGADGGPAPRLCDVELSKKQARELFHILLKDVQRMLCAGVVHGDLSDFNVLLSPEEPVIIDFPQAVDPAHNRNAKKLLIRDVKNLTLFLSRWEPRLRKTRYAEEMWDLYEKNDLTPYTELTGKFRGSDHKANVQSVLDEIAAAARADFQRRVALGLEEPDDDERERQAQVARFKRRSDKRSQQKSAPGKDSSGGDAKPRSERQGDNNKRSRNRKRRGPRSEDQAAQSQGQQRKRRGNDTHDDRRSDSPNQGRNERTSEGRRKKRSGGRPDTSGPTASASKPRQSTRKPRSASEDNSSPPKQRRRRKPRNKASTPTVVEIRRRRD
ncbi:MAG: PA4780 family RIO1-like protein kinase [Myxococcota bacterium]|nr:PA4780 family RIO1-like protein kinase [Myxococcota bacterium]